MDKKKCLICGKEFTPKVSSKRYCYEQHIVKCSICGNNVNLNKIRTNRLERYLKEGVIFCSQKCSCIYNGNKKFVINNENKIPKLRELVETTNISYTEIAKQLEVTLDFVSSRIKKYNIKRPIKLQQQCKENKNKTISNVKKDLFKDSNYRNRVLSKVRQTCLQRYGYEYNFKDSNEIKKYKQTKYKKYNGNYFSEEQIKRIIENRYNNTTKEQQIFKRRKTKLEKYGNENYINIDKMRNTRLQRYGNPNYVNKEQISKTWNSKTDLEKQKIVNRVKQTKLEKYGDENYTNMEKHRNTLFEKYKVDNATYIYLPTRTVDIITDENKFREYLLNIPYENRTTLNISKDLGLNRTSVLPIYYKHNCIDIPLNNKKSYLEDEVSEIIKSYNIDNVITNTRSVISPYELDIYVPDKKVAIECNGTYWHSTENQKDSKYHYMKSTLCEEKGIRLIHIFEYEWLNERQRPILINIIKNALGINENKIYARKLIIEERESKTLKEFFNKNNIQGFRGGQKAICLVDKNTKEVYMSYIIGKAFFGKGKYDLEIIRGATKLGYTIVGGASKIWDYIIKTYNPNSIVYYIDYNYFNGNSLKNLPDMEFIKTQPGFKNYFIETGEVKNRDPMHHKQITEGYKDGSILQIWNAGTKVYVWNKSK